MPRLVRSLLILAFLLSMAAVEAQEAATPEDAGSQQSDGNSAPVADQGDDADEQGAQEQVAEEDNPDDAPVGDSPSRFIPTEQVSQDLGVSFPADI